MSAPLLIASETFTPTEAEALRAVGPSVEVANPAGVLALPEAERAQIKVAAFKGFAPFGADVIAALPALELIANYGVGYDSIDVVAARAQGVVVTNTPDVLNDDVADLTVGMMLAQARTLVAGDAWVRQGRWPEAPLPLNRKMSGASVGILGLGRIGRAIAERLVAFDMEVHYHSRSEKETPGWQFHSDPVDLAAAVDWLVVALVGGPETERYVSRAVIEALGPRGVLVNIARGSVVDEPAMIDALEAGRLGGAALDVFLNEPTVDERLLALPNVVLQPHQGSATVETRGAMAQLQLDNIRAHLAGQPVLTPV